MKNEEGCHKRSLPQHTVVLKRTHDEWCPNFRVNIFTEYNNTEIVREIIYDYVEVSFNRSHDTDGDSIFIVVVSGNDDTMVQKDFVSELDAWNCFLDVIKLEFVDFDILREMKFESYGEII
jgi:hypothetical protein